MSGLLRTITPFFICLALLLCSDAAGARHLRSSQASSKGELGPASIQLHNRTGIDTRDFVRVSESIIATPEPVSLALFGSGLTLLGVGLLRYSRRTKPAANRRDARRAVGVRSLRFARSANGNQYPRPNVAAPERLVSTYVSSGAR